MHPYPHPPPARPMTNYAIPSIALAMLAIPTGMFTCIVGALLFGLPGAICGHIGEVETRDGTRSGRLLAMTGCVLSWISPVLSGFVLVMIGVLSD